MFRVSSSVFSVLQFSITEQLLYINVQRVREGLVFKAQGHLWGVECGVWECKARARDLRDIRFLPSLFCLLVLVQHRFMKCLCTVQLSIGTAIMNGPIREASCVVCGLEVGV